MCTLFMVLCDGFETHNFFPHMNERTSNEFSPMQTIIITRKQYNTKCGCDSGKSFNSNTP